MNQDQVAAKRICSHEDDTQFLMYSLQNLRTCVVFVWAELSYLMYDDPIFDITVLYSTICLTCTVEGFQASN